MGTKPTVTLSPREFQIIVRLAKGLTAKQACKELGISHRFSQGLRQSAYLKLNIQHRREIPRRLSEVNLTMPKWWNSRKLGFFG